MEGLVATLRVLQRIPIPEAVAKKDATYTAVSADDVNIWCTLDEALFREERVKASTFDHDVAAATATAPADFPHSATATSTAQSRYTIPTTAAAPSTGRWGSPHSALPVSPAAAPSSVSPYSTYSDHSTYTYGRHPSAAGGHHSQSQQYSYGAPILNQYTTTAASPYAAAVAPGYPSPAPVPSLSLPPLPEQPPVPVSSQTSRSLPPLPAQPPAPSKY